MRRAERVRHDESSERGDTVIVEVTKSVRDFLHFSGHKQKKNTLAKRRPLESELCQTPPVSSFSVIFTRVTV